LKQTADVKIALEPIRDLDIDIDFKKSYSETYTDQFKKVKGGDFTQGFDIIMGSYNYTHIGLNTLFDDGVDLYDRFRTKRQEVSRALANKKVLSEGGNTLTGHKTVEFEGFYEGFGPENSDVAIPAFLDVYTGRTFDIDGKSLQDIVSQRTYIPAPNWTIKYDGLGKLDLFKDIISSFAIRHAYIGTTTVGSFSSNALFTPFSDQDKNTLSSSSNGNYFSEINTPSIRIADQFAPLIGFSLKLKNEMTFEAGYNKSRTLSLTQLNLSESLNSDINFGFGYTIKNFRANAKSKRKKRSRKKQKDDAESEEDGDVLGGKRGRGKVSRNRGKTLTMNLDFSLTDSEENLYNLGQNTEPTTNRGTTNLIISPSVDYDINKNLTMRFFINYNQSTPKNTINVSRLDIRGGVTAQLKIN